MSIESELAKRDRLLAEKSARIRELEAQLAERTCGNEDEDLDAWFKCSACGLHSKLEIFGGGYGLPNYCPNCGARVVD